MTKIQPKIKGEVNLIIDFRTTTTSLCTFGCDNNIVDSLIHQHLL